MSPSEHAEQDDEHRLVELMMAYQQGDLGAFEQVYAILAPNLRRYFRNAERDISVVDDLVQDTFLEMHRARRTYTPPLPVRPWAFGVARNVLARKRRAAHLSAQYTQSIGDDDLPQPAQSNTLPGANALDIEQALAGLPTSTREPWLLHHVFGFSFHSIATHLGITIMAAKLRSSRATQALRRALSDKGEETE
jgi:RNA polymerase sigma-70 factor, ECF subfamily